jgi:hypothetical protein
LFEDLGGCCRWVERDEFGADITSADIEDLADPVE